MKYLIALILPPLAVLLCMKPWQAMINIVLTLCFWIPGMLHALLVVNQNIGDKRHEEMMDAMAAQVGVRDNS